MHGSSPFSADAAASARRSWLSRSAYPPTGSGIKLFTLSLEAFPGVSKAMDKRTAAIIMTHQPRSAAPISFAEVRTAAVKAKKDQNLGSRTCW